MRKMARGILAVAGFAAAMMVATPASAAYYIIYWIDYPGGQWDGYEYYCQGGNLIEEFGGKNGTPTFHQADPYFPC
jgi:hypothetical protein